MINESKKSIRKKFNPPTKSGSKKIFVKAAAFLILAIFIIGNLPDLKIIAAGTITGRVFQDYNGSGTFDTAGSTALPAIDAGVVGVTVTAYDAAEVSRGTTTTVQCTGVNAPVTGCLSAADRGLYSLSATGTGPYRIEFTGLPSGFLPSARSTDSVTDGTTTTAGSTVQFVADGATANVNLAVNSAEDYCQNNPTLCTAIFRPGNQTGTRSTTVSFPYNAPTANTNLANESQTGTVYGTAYQKSSKTVFQSAYMKRHAGFGPLGTGGIYKINLSSGTPVFSNYVNLQTLGINTGTDPRTAAGYQALPADGATPSYDQGAYTEVGKRSIGDLDYDEGRNTLWFINLNDRRLHGIRNVSPTVAPVAADLVRDTSNALGFNVNTATPVTCTNGVLRPFGLEIYRGLVYVGAVCTGETTGAVAADLRAYVFSINPDAPAAGFTQVANFALNYARTRIAFGGNAPWTTWFSSDNNRTIPGGGTPQPIVSDLEFDKDGSLIMSLKDRWGDQYAVNQYLPTVNQTGTTRVTEIYGFGDILRFCSSGGTLANPGTTGCPNNPRPANENNFTANGNAGGSQGPSGGEFYGGDWGPDDPDSFGESTNGALALLPGSNRVVATSLDANNYYSNGIQAMSNTDGSRLSGYDVYQGGNNITTNDFNKGNGLGDLELLCDSAPIELGNRVWRDTDNDGVQDAGEAAIAGVTVRLFNAANTLIATAVTDASGEYYFTSGTTADATLTDNIGIVNGQITPNTAYQIRFDRAADYTTGGALAGLVATRANATQQAGAVDASDSDALQVNNPTGSPTGIFPVITYTTGAAGANDHTLDAGFALPVSIGSTVFNDFNNNGAFDTGETGIGGVSVELLYDADNDGAISVAEAATPLAATTTSAVAGSVGNYFFGNLTPGNYQVRIPTAPTAAPLSSTTTDAADNGQDNDDNGTQAGGYNTATVSPIITLTPGAEPLNAVETGQGGTLDDATTDANGDMTVDFGFFAPVSLGNRVFLDANNNGVFDTGDSALANVTVNLYVDANNDGTADGGIFASMITDANGLYLFSSLAPNTYIVGVVTPTGLTSSSVNGGDPDTNAADNDNNGVLVVGNETRSNPVTLTVGGEPTGETPDNDSVTPDLSENLTVDFGFTAAYSLGNRVFFDTNNNGQRNTAEVGVANVSVSVFAAADTTFANVLNTVTTDSSGYYRFDNLGSGSYVVRINPVNFQSGGALVGYQNTTGNTTADVDSTDTLGGEDGINPPGAANTVQTNGIVSSTVVLGDTAEPINETDLQTVGPFAGQGAADNQANMTIDFGFYRMNLSGTLWNDSNNDGSQGGVEAGIAGYTVRLYNDATTTEILVGPDGILGTSDDTTGGMVTASNGGYNFQGLPAGTYRVVVTSGGATSSTPTVTDPNGNADNDDNGFPDNTTLFPGRTISGTIMLTPGGEVSFTNSNGQTLNPTIDFGFVLSPTVVKLDKFDAFSDGNSVELKWSTGDEAGNLGFNVYREVNGKRQLLNAAPIAGNALRSNAQLTASGSDYTWTDKEFVAGAVYYLEDLDVNGSAELHGAVAPQSRQTLDNQPNAKTFSDLATAGDSTGLNEIVTGAKVAVPTVKELNALTIRQQQIAALGGAKITVRRDGWYRVTARQLAAAGFDIKSNSQLWQLYADGAEVPFKLNSDSIEFFGRGLDTPLTDQRAYYLVVGQTNGLRINAVENNSAGENADANGFGVTVERKDRAVYVSTILNGDNDNWFGAAITRSSQTVQTLNAVNVVDGQAHLSVKLQGVVANDHAVSVRFNDMELGTVEFSGFENKQFEFDLPATAMREGINRVYLQSTGGNNDASLVDSIRLSYRRGYTTNNNQLRFTVPAAQTARVNGFTDANISVYEIRSGAAAQQVVVKVENSEDSSGFSLGAATYDRELIAVADSTVEQSTVTRNIPSTWNNAANQANFVIITSDELQASAGRLAKMREAQGLKTQVVAVEDIFDEFSFGRRDPNAIKSFLKTATTKWQTKPQYALLFGDSSYDTRNNLGLIVTRDIVPTKSVDTEAMETSSDSWLADFDNDGAEDIALGRLPVGNASEAAAAVEKLARFDAQGARSENTNVLVADRGFESYSETLQSLLPNGINAVRIDRSAMTDAETHQSIVERLNANPLLVTYTGHGSQNVWATNSIFRSEDAAQLSNGQLSFYLLMNCLNGYNHQPTGESLGEALFRSSNGAVAVWTSSGITQPDKQAAISQAFTRFAFSGSGRTIRLGDVVKAAKRASDDSDVRRTWQLIGDPTISVK